MFFLSLKQNFFKEITICVLTPNFFSEDNEQKEVNLNGKTFTFTQQLLKTWGWCDNLDAKILKNDIFHV